MNVTIYTKTTYAYDHVHLSPVQTSTFRRKLLDVDMNIGTEMNAASSSVPTDTSRSISEIDDWTDEEEQEWDNLFAQPHVQAGLSKLAEEAEQQFVLGEFEEGGFAVE